MRPRPTPATGVFASGLPPVMVRHTGSVSSTDRGGTFPKETKPPRMHYPADAIPPETLEEHSIYPVDHRLLKIPMTLEESTHSHPGTEPWNNCDPKSSLQYHARKEIRRLYAEKQREMLLPPEPDKADSEKTSSLDRDTAHQSGVDKSDGFSKLREETKNTRRVLHESMDCNGAADPEDFDKVFSMFDGTPRDESILTETEEWILPPWDSPEPLQAPSLSALSSMTEWDPELDLDFQTEAQERWSDFRYMVPQTSSDVESLQQALEITRMDFWVRNPKETYPGHLSQYKGESYGSQHRRLQHAFCRIWQDHEQDPPPELYRLPPWIFGFESCYWNPSIWGNNAKKRAYNKGLAEMAAEKNRKGLDKLHYQGWRARLKELDVPPTLADFTSSRLKD
ncbi:MAG: hypothetical protein Q9175_002230 [Cornicularia normoerica]